MEEDFEEFHNDYVEILFMRGCDNLEEGWYIYFLDEHGYVWDSAGPFDTEAAAKNAAASGFTD